ncbi:MAG: hydrogenase iron-sulfur subunit [Candidatus Lokiarchaeota archaeon]|nr:hydrogenase iron-sulfur subunit [Candidatus Lokiarchaeota archaeon]MBD3201510.1 hydrogenase iron-sulfur subunit [Candidatus Lokiarchaeota archaeon]
MISYWMKLSHYQKEVSSAMSECDEYENVVVFMCNECGQGSANTAGVARMSYDPAMRIVRVQCTGQVGPIQIMDALNSGADAVACVGCCLGACHFFNGNVISMHRIKIMKKLFKELGYSDQFVNQYTSRAAEGETAVGDFDDIIERLCSAIQEGGTIQNEC